MNPTSNSTFKAYDSGYDFDPEYARLKACSDSCRNREAASSFSVFGEDKMVYSNLAVDVYRTPDGKYYSI